jgi:hypothetical protein
MTCNAHMSEQTGKGSWCGWQGWCAATPGEGLGSVMAQQGATCRELQREPAPPRPAPPGQAPPRATPPRPAPPRSAPPRQKGALEMIVYSSAEYSQSPPPHLGSSTQLWAVHSQEIIQPGSRLSKCMPKVLLQLEMCLGSACWKSMPGRQQHFEASPSFTKEAQK